MVCGILSFSSALSPISISHYRNRTAPKLKTDLSSSITLGIRCSSSSSDVPQTFEKSENDAAMTGGAFDFTRATTSLTDNKSIASSKKVTLVRHGLSSWNEESRVQGSSNQSVLTETGVMQAERCRKAIANMHFDQCYSSPISRAKSTAEIIWQGREEPLVFLDSLKEAHLFFLEGMKNEDAKQRYPKEYATWREDPANFYVNGIYPVRELWGTAREAWKEILLTPGEHVLVITHKSILRALICTALGLGPERFRAIDVNNGGISVFNFNKKGEAMIQSLNMTAHIVEVSNSNDKLGVVKGRWVKHACSKCCRDGKVTDTLEGADPSCLANKVARVVGSAKPGEPSLETVQELAKENGSFQEQEQIQTQTGLDDALKRRMQQLIDSNRLMLFMKGAPKEPKCKVSTLVVHILNKDNEVMEGIQKYSNWPTIPQLYNKGKLGGWGDIAFLMRRNGELGEFSIDHETNSLNCDN